jgi:hypothetical protein
MRHLLGDDCELVTKQITMNFESVDTDGDCEIDRAGFEAFFNLMMVEGSDAKENASIATVKRGLQCMSKCHDMFESSKNHLSGQHKDEFGIKKHLQGDGKFSSKNWNILYCGGSQPVLD